jgi:hypothetical protein
VVLFRFISDGVVANVHNVAVRLEGLGGCNGGTKAAEQFCGCCGGGAKAAENG